MNKLLNYITASGLTITQSANELGCTRQYLGRVCNGLNCGRVLGEKIEVWSNKVVGKHDVMWQEQDFYE